jgi:catechol 2,3-dioxygenase-like lactoylglutathione lyase family enzyme
VGKEKRKVLFVIQSSGSFVMIVEAALTAMVSDVDRAVDFYVETLGFGLREKYGSKYAEVQVNGFVMGLHLRDSGTMEVGGSNGLFIGFRVEDLDSSMADLRIKGVKFSTGVEEGVAGKFVYFADPDGNKLYFWQNKT